MTLLLTRSDIVGLLDVPAVLRTMRAGFGAIQEVEPQRIRTDLAGPGTATALLPGSIPGIPAYTVKVNAKFPAATPALRGVVCLHDLTDGTLLAVLDSATITAWRTGLAAALATDVLAAPGARTLGVIGTGAQAAMVVRGLTSLRPIEQLVGYDVDRPRAQDFLAAQGIAGSVADGPSDVAARAEIVALATWSREPLLTAADVRPGRHFTTLGADEPGKVELGADLLGGARVVVDDARLAVAMGAVGNVGLGAGAIAATLGEVLTGARAGRQSAGQVTVYAPVGLPWQDLAISWPVYQAARATGVGRTIDFLS
ncbi:ornithine cyclodeaminase/mu-crystallin [Kribbella flavida DSM 17836]|uniref:Ornithine cyclodeaminase/mu-crystallin n=1 Tax=Kribbella flavida (strain DSM 17836 / JCM 10339 / NBRC 14399) TaxID=479435 RepID=D2PZZ7_KRIFD|nr:ornithine cyclodeaminase family protein [Kribbella flavida]ADB29995.1 ornithine cyclodeaminase/mu-crystallin [Kribbella flavida DSM 17836]